MVANASYIDGCIITSANLLSWKDIWTESIHARMIAVCPHTTGFWQSVERFSWEAVKSRTNDRRMSQSSNANPALLSRLAENLAATEKVASVGNTHDNTTIAADPALSAGT